MPVMGNTTATKGSRPARRKAAASLPASPTSLDDALFTTTQQRVLGRRAQRTQPGEPFRSRLQRRPREETLDAFIQAYAKPGYQPCENEELEPAYEKIALFASSNGVPTHAARQLQNGGWTSKARASGG